MNKKFLKLEDLAQRFENGDWRLENVHPDYADRFGPGRVVESKESDVTGMPDGENGHVYIAEACGFGEELEKRAAYIAAANPNTVLALVKNIRKLEREVEVFRSYGNKECTAMADEALDNDDTT